jgi:predicted ATPase/DNA-binding CsgD family transcriptional regulator
MGVMESGGVQAVRQDSTALPADLSSFVGRRSELSEVKRLLATNRLATLTGVGGVGKTRVALRVATELSRRFNDGVAWVELADLRDHRLLAQTVEDRLLIPEKIDRDPVVNVAHFLRERDLLLVLDNAEHVLDECAELVEHLLRRAPSLRVLVTSRQALGIPGEQVLPLAPLRVPTEEQALEPGAGVVYSSLALFEERAAASSPGFAITEENQVLVAEICRRLDGIPLAIELATVKLRVLPIDELARRLDARLEMLGQSGRLSAGRHQTLQATIDWSYDLCTPEERLLWARASVFAGGFDVAAAESCCADDAQLPRSGVLEAVGQLLDKSVLTRTVVDGRVRFKLLEPLREHGLAMLGAAGEAQQGKDRHLEWCLGLVDEACLQWFGPMQERWCVTLRLEKANIRAAAEHCLQQQERVDDALRLLGRPWFLWVALFLDEGRHWLDRVLAAKGVPSPARATALATSAYIAALQGDAAEADALSLDSRTMAAELNDVTSLAYGTHMGGLNALFVDPPRAVALLSEALALYQSSPDTLDDFVTGLRVQLGLSLLFEADLDGAAEQFAICKELCTVTGEHWLLSYALYGEGFVCFLRGDFETAERCTLEAVAIKRFFGDTLGLAVCLDLLGWIEAEFGDAQRAAVLLGSAARRWETFGVSLFGSEHWLAMRQAAVDTCNRALGDVRFAAAVAQGEALAPGDALGFALREGGVPDSVEEPVVTSLTPREREIAALVAEGLSNKDISKRLVIAQRTAECHVENILTKFGFRSRSQIAAWVAEHRTAVG